MITIFASPKPFDDPKINLAQRNALASWKHLNTNCQIILFGNDFGTKDVADEFEFQHVSDIKCNEEGLPRLDEMFRIAESISNNDILMYINADIILLSNFISSLSIILDRMNGLPFLAVGQRYDYDLEESLDVDNPNWQSELLSSVIANSELRGPAAIDYFIYRRGMWRNTLPPFVIGRVQFDNWLIFNARKMGVDVIDATQGISAVHQNHAQKPNHFFNRRLSDAAQAQMQLASEMHVPFLIVDANLELVSGHVKKPKYCLLRLKRAVLTGESLYPDNAIFFRFINCLYRAFQKIIYSR